MIDVQSKFIDYTSWIYARSINGFVTHDNGKCLAESIVVFKFPNILTLLF